MSSEARHLHAHVSMLAGTIGERNPFNRPALDQAQRYIEKQFRSLGLKPMVQEYRSDGLSMIDDGTVFYNVEARLGEGAGRPVLVIGAHYDSAPGTPGADDNASGTAALLELARQLKDKPLTREIRLVAFSNEEPPAFFTRNMGSFHYAQALKKEGRPVIGMISLEMLGYYNDSPGSQIYPPFLSLFYPKEGNFIGLVGNLPSRRFLKACRQAWQGASDFPLETAALPGFISATVLSDHFNFQRAGFPGLMLTDTAFYRNPHYHEATDTPQRLDYERMAKLLEALSGMALTLAK
ncbi:MAG: M28 family peptidase [Elusimicrobia bacterium]|nr:M28 family peptidase [Elusimicrobiota bacterium]